MTRREARAGGRCAAVSGCRVAGEIAVDGKPAQGAFSNDNRKTTGSEFVASVSGEGA